MSATRKIYCSAPENCRITVFSLTLAFRPWELLQTSVRHAMTVLVGEQLAGVTKRGLIEVFRSHLTGHEQ